jgi:hypothetical protein
MNESFEDFRMAHLVRTAALWKRLCELGATESSLLDFDFTFTAPSKDAAEKLRSELSSYPIKTEATGLLKRSFSLSGTSGPIAWNEAQLLKWVDYLIQVGRDAGCQFEGCGANAPSSTI